MGIQIAQSVQLETEECYKCGVVFAMPASMLRNFRDKGGSFWCPNGHSQCYTKSELDRLREKLAEQTRQATFMAERAVNAEKQIVKLKKRVKAGVCPCCKRTFRQLALHMKHKHPEFAK